MATVKPHPILTFSVVYIFMSFAVIAPIPGFSKIYREVTDGPSFAEIS